MWAPVRSLRGSLSFWPFPTFYIFSRGLWNFYESKSPAFIYGRAMNCYINYARHVPSRSSLSTVFSLSLSLSLSSERGVSRDRWIGLSHVKFPRRDT